MNIWWSLDAKNTWFHAYVTHLWTLPFHLPHPHKKPCSDRLARLWQWQQVKTLSYMTWEHTGTIKLKSPGGCNQKALFGVGPLTKCVTPYEYWNHQAQMKGYVLLSVGRMQIVWTSWKHCRMKQWNGEWTTFYTWPTKNTNARGVRVLFNIVAAPRM